MTDHRFIGRGVVKHKRATLPISLPMGNVFENRDLTMKDGRTKHLCWACASEWQRDEYWPPMPPGCCLCARCGVLIYTGGDDPSNAEMDVCRECDRAIRDEVTP